MLDPEDIDIVGIFFDQIDMAGPFMPFKDLQERIENAPMEVLASPDFPYVNGLYKGREIYEGLHIIKNDFAFDAFSDLEKRVFDATDELKESAEFQFTLGLYDGRMIHEGLGGIKDAE